ncbi:MAG: hypothetical protein NWQ63_04800 [Schleiferiaceae bacterium]|jgi:hypothetical protein|nr:hypothetical protein [Schleiferiaceae bacterium]MDP4759093.1 hypothetical protein [Schleiferiaceae bacterium]MDP4768093.1 hypothetical protein [Schleiferiaceae bacterium]MDP4877748.1 hypothetical protein [Schleiferiaceae bacterium]MDP4959309.1 hypothetical protein [Schleiferiaceae bacterium]
MDKQRTYKASDAQLNELKAKLHRIPEQHLVDRTASPVVATKSHYMHIVRWSMTAAAAIALAVFFWPNTSGNTSEVTEDLIAEMYSLGYVQIEDMYSFVEPDSLDFADVEIDADVYYDYYNSDYEYLEL